jgi:hypothetical protein
VALPEHRSWPGKTQERSMRDGWVWTDEESTSNVMILGWDNDEEEDEEWEEDQDWDEEDEEDLGEDWEEEDEEEEEDWEEWEEEFEEDEDDDPFSRKKSGRPKWD